MNVRTLGRRVWSLCFVVCLAWSLVACETVPDVPPEAPWPPLFEAVLVGDVPKVKELAAGGADVNQSFSRKLYSPTFTPLDRAVNRCDVSMVETLVSLGANDRSLLNQVFDCDRSRHLPLIKALSIIKDVDLNIGVSWQGYGSTPLGMAAANGDIPLAQFLLRKGAKVNGNCPIRCEYHRIAPLQVAARVCDPAMVRFLVDAHADTVVLDDQLYAPIIHLLEAKAGSDAQMAEVIRILAVRGISSVTYNSPKGPALGFVTNNMPETRQLLLSLGASQAAVDQFRAAEEAKFEKARKEGLARAAEEEALKAAIEKKAKELEAKGISMSSDGSGNCTCTRRTQRYVAPRSSSGMVRGNQGHYEFYDETVPCACPR